MQDNNLSWFQYRILFKILGTKDYLKKIKITEADKCGLCKKSEESIFHLFSLCDQANLIWDGIRQWIKNKIGFDLGFNHTMKTRLGQLGANISPDRSSLTPQVLIGNF